MSDWPDMRAYTTGLFTEPPGPALDAKLGAAYDTHPTIVDRCVERIAARHAAGNVRSPWAILALDVAQAIEATETTGTRPTTTNRQTALANYAHWLSNAGIHIDREDELLLETFGPLGHLRPWAQINLENHAAENAQPDWKPGTAQGEHQLVTRTLEAWHKHRATGETIDAEELERAAKWTHDQAATHLKTTHPESAFAEAITDGTPT